MLQIIIGNIDEVIGQVTFAAKQSVPFPMASIVSAALVPMVLLLSCSVVLIVAIGLVFRRKYKAKAMEQQNLEAEMNELKSISVLKSSGKLGKLDIITKIYGHYDYQINKIDVLLEEFTQFLPANLIIQSSELQMLDVSLGQGKSTVIIPLTSPYK